MSKPVLSPRRWSLPRSVLVVGLTAALALSGAAAWAYFLAGTGTGTATSASLSDLALSAGTPSTALYPGGTTSLTLTARNPNHTPIQFSTVSVDTSQGTSGFTVDAQHVAAGCTVALAALTYTAQNTGWTVPGSSSNVAVALSSNVLAMGTTAPSSCQGATITVYLKAS